MSSLPTTPAHTESKPTSPPPRRMHSIEKKQRIVEERLLPCALVARSAQAHGVSANLVFLWRNHYQQGLLGTATPETAMLPTDFWLRFPGTNAPAVT